MKKMSYESGKLTSPVKIKSGMAGRLSRDEGRELGQAMVELAFLLPLFLTLVFGIIELSRAWAAKHTLTIAVREGARILVLPYGAGLPYATEDEVMKAAEEAVKGYMNSAGLVVSTSTKIIPLKVTPGNDSVYGTEDDKKELNYRNAVRGERVGFVVSHNFESPVAAFLNVFGNDSSGNGFRMSATCVMNHE